MATASDDLTVVFTSDDAGAGDVAPFDQLLEMLATRGVRGTLFTIPCAGGTPLSERPEWIAALKRAAAAGHEIGLHGYAHEGFEVGAPPPFMLDLMGPGAWATLQTGRAQFQRAWRVEALERKIRDGAAIIEAVLGRRPTTWRSPCCAVCSNLFVALRQAGIVADSSLIVNPQGWPYCAKDFETVLEWDTAHPPYAFRYHAGVVEVPVVSEYTWYLQSERESRQAWALIAADCERAQRQSRLFTAMSHFFAMSAGSRRGLELYERFFAYVESRWHVRYATVAEVARGPLGPWPV